MEDEEEEDVNLKPGSVVESSKASYVIVKLLGEGGFGAVYKVHDKNDKRKEYAMKVEKKLESRRHSKLKMEIAILKLVASERKDSHFTSIIDRGKKETYFFLVMELVGQSLAALKMARPTKVFSISTGLGAGIQCLEACEDLHKFGFIHRDLKPANYAIGLYEKRRTVYILDFGIARKILNPKGELKAPRQTVRFKGTIRFASIACHKNIEMGPKDDCESWFYLLLDLIMPRGLLWKSIPDKNLVRKVKEEMRTNRREAAFYGVKCKTQLMSVMDYLDTLQYQDRVDYDYIYKLLQIGAKTAGGNVDLPYDWEVGDDPTQSMSGEEKPRLPKPKKRKKRKVANLSPARTPLQQMKSRSPKIVAEVDGGQKERVALSAVAAAKEGQVQKSVSVATKSKGPYQEKGFFSVAAAAKRQQLNKSEASSTSSGLSVRPGQTRRRGRRARTKRRKRRSRSSSSSSSEERSAGGKDISGEAERGTNKPNRGKRRTHRGKTKYRQKSRTKTRTKSATGERSSASCTTPVGSRPTSARKLRRTHRRKPKKRSSLVCSSSEERSLGEKDASEREIGTSQSPHVEYPEGTHGERGPSAETGIISHQKIKPKSAMGGPQSVYLMCKSPFSTSLEKPTGAGNKDNQSIL